MPGRAPRFWSRNNSFAAGALTPLSLLYGWAATRRMKRAPRVPVPLPVICVGNPTVGGSGKTPVAIAIAQAAHGIGLKPGFLSRGHGGKDHMPRLVRPDDTAAEVGDEPLLLAKHGSVAVTPDRAAGAMLLKQEGCDLLIMDDGFQSARIAIDCALLVVDRSYGFGNGRVLPAGPLRAPLTAHLAYADAVIAMGEGDRPHAFLQQAAASGLPVIAARLVPRDAEIVRGRRLLAFAGIGRPAKFFATLEEAGARVEEPRAFGDHHPYSSRELSALRHDASRRGLTLATTAKDAARLRGHAPADFLSELLVFEIEARFDNPSAPAELIARALANWQARD